jgi:hypothetical protein
VSETNDEQAAAIKVETMQRIYNICREGTRGEAAGILAAVFGSLFHDLDMAQRVQFLAQIDKCVAGGGILGRAMEQRYQEMQRGQGDDGEMDQPTGTEQQPETD